ncbi:MAG: YqaA family protein [Arenicellales bacterium]|nr:DedA family protein [Gammaproteobacteria bacterium]NDA15382.1 DedA family protein [Gammaproteobacteria bacterium]NDG44798.1 DedA family protein [Gammaproteobacteria bacterium]
MKIFSRLYDWVLGWAKHPHASRYLAALSFAESSFFPIPPDVMLAPMALARRDRAWGFAFITTFWSVLGGALGYLIGMFLFDVLAQPLISFYDASEAFATAQEKFKAHGVWIVFIAGFTPIPYKIFTISAGLASMAFLPFVVASLIGRGARFFLVSALIYFGGERFESGLRRYVDLIGWLVIALIVVGLGVYYGIK